MKAEFPDDYSPEQLERDIACIVDGGSFYSRPQELLQNFIQPPEFIEQFFADSTIVFDANVLSHVYVMSEVLSKGFFEVLEGFDDVWISRQAAEEYHRHIPSALKEAGSPGSVLTDFKKQLQNLVSSQTKKKFENAEWHWFYDDANYNQFIKLADRLIEDAAKERQRLIQSYKSTKERIAKRFEGKLGPAPTENETKKYEEEFKRRKEAKLPPYCADDDPKDGDIRIWLQTIDYAKMQCKKNIVFVTDDTKDNWFLKVDGKRISPRPELCLEMKRVTDRSLWICTTSEFIKTGRWALQLTPTPALEREIERVKLQEKEALASAADRVIAKKRAEIRQAQIALLPYTHPFMPHPRPIGINELLLLQEFGGNSFQDPELVKLNEAMNQLNEDLKPFREAQAEQDKMNERIRKANLELLNSTKIPNETADMFKEKDGDS